MKVVGRTKINPHNIADDRLRESAKCFTMFRVKLKELRNALGAHHADLVRAEASQARVLNAITQVSRDTNSSRLPPFLLDGETLFETVHEKCRREASARLKQYQVQLVTYVTHWESTVSTRIMNELKHVDKLFKTFGRYHKKLESLQEAANKKKVVKDVDLEKIARNKGKLETAKKEYRRNVIGVTLFIDEVTERGWKDLLPFLIRMITFDMDSTATMADNVARLMVVRQDLECLAERFDMNPDMIRNGRIDTLLQQDAVAFVRAQGMQEIESISSSSASPYIPPRSHNHPRANPQSESSGSTSDNDSGVLPVYENDRPGNVNRTPTAPPEYDFEDQESIMTDLSSVYFNGTMHPMDDDSETSLTPEQHDFGTFGKSCPAVPL